MGDGRGIRDFIGPYKYRPNSDIIFRVAHMSSAYSPAGHSPRLSLVGHPMNKNASHSKRVTRSISEYDHKNVYTSVAYRHPAVTRTLGDGSQRMGVDSTVTACHDSDQECGWSRADPGGGQGGHDPPKTCFRDHQKRPWPPHPQPPIGVNTNSQHTLSYKYEAIN